MQLLSKDQILNASDRSFREVEVPEWGGTVRVGSMTAAERDAFEASMVDARGKGKTSKTLENFRARFVAKCVVDEDGQRLFSDSDIVALGGKSAAVLSKLFDVAREVNGMTEADVEELEGN